MMRKIWLSIGEDKRNDILGVLFATLGIILFLSLVTHSASDPSLFSSTSNTSVHNLIGRPGAWISDLSFQLFGKAAFLIPVLIWLCCFAWWRQRPVNAGVLQFTGATIALLCACGLLSLFSVDKTGVTRTGGIIGHAVASLATTLGDVGGALSLVSLLIISMVLVTDLRLKSVGAAIEGIAFRFFERISNFFQEYLRRRKEKKEERILKKKSRKPAKKLSTKDLFAPEVADAPIRLSSAKPKRKKLSLKKDVLEQLPPTQDELQQDNLEDDFVGESGQLQLPPLSMLEKPEQTEVEIPMDEIRKYSETLEKTLQEFGIEATVVGFQRGPVITRYELKLAPGIKVNKITGLTDNLALSLKASPIRVLAPIPGRGTIGVEVPNKDQQKVCLRQLLESKDFQKSQAKLTIALGKTLSGELFYADLNKMPHLLIAGATGAGKSVCINTLITSIIYKATPEQVKFLMVDPKRVELRIYEDIPHLMAPVITDSRRAGAALRWVVEEMEERFSSLARISCRDLRSYNAKMAKMLKNGTLEDADAMVLKPFLPYIVVIIDELADLMTYARNDTEVLIASLAQKARAVGIHLVIATQRPSVNVLTGIIKANFPSRIAFQVASKVDSRTILDSNGAEALLGKGDMLFSSASALRPVRLQGSFVSTEEIEQVCAFLKSQAKPDYLEKEFEDDEEEKSSSWQDFTDTSTAKQTTMFDIPLPSELEDQHIFPKDVDLYDMARQFVIETGSASTSLLQRRFKIGYGRAARFLDQMEQEGLVGPPRGSRPRDVLLDVPDSEDDDDGNGEQ